MADLLAHSMSSATLVGMVPTFNVQHSIRLADRLLHGRPAKSEPGLLETWCGQDLSREFKRQLEFADHVRRLLGFPVSQFTVWGSGGKLFAGPITQERLTFWCRRIAGNRQCLKDDTVVSPWTGLWREKWAPVEITRAKRGLSFKDRDGTILTFRVLDGPACPFEFERWFPNKSFWTFAAELGPNQRGRRKHRYQGNRGELVGMRLAVLLAPQERHIDEPTEFLKFDRYAGDGFRAYNQRLVRERSKPCPAGYIDPCHECVVGLDQCPTNTPGCMPRACRPVTLRAATCKLCEGKTWHDAGQCMRCQRLFPPKTKFIPTP